MKIPTVRTGKGHCCEYDDGPIKLWLKKRKRSQKRSDKQKVKKEIKKYE